MPNRTELRYALTTEEYLARATTGSPTQTAKDRKRHIKYDIRRLKDADRADAPRTLKDGNCKCQAKKQIVRTNNYDNKM